MWSFASTTWRSSTSGSRMQQSAGIPSYPTSTGAHRPFLFSTLAAAAGGTSSFSSPLPLSHGSTSLPRTAFSASLPLSNISAAGAAHGHPTLSAPGEAIAGTSATKPSPTRSRPRARPRASLPSRFAMSLLRTTARVAVASRIGLSAALYATASWYDKEMDEYRRYLAYQGALDAAAAVASAAAEEGGGGAGEATAAAAAAAAIAAAQAAEAAAAKGGKMPPPPEWVTMILPDGAHTHSKDGAVTQAGSSGVGAEAYSAARTGSGQDYSPPVDPPIVGGGGALPTAARVVTPRHLPPPLASDAIAAAVADATAAAAAEGAGAGRAWLRPPGTSSPLPAWLHLLLPTAVAGSVEDAVLPLVRAAHTMKAVAATIADFSLAFSAVMKPPGADALALGLMGGPAGGRARAKAREKAEAEAAAILKSQRAEGVDGNAKNTGNRNVLRQSMGDALDNELSAATDSPFLEDSAPVAVAVNEADDDPEARALEAFEADLLSAAESTSSGATSTDKEAILAAARRAAAERRWATAVAAAHYRSARRLLMLGVKQGGAYVKAAQHFANAGHGAPPVYKSLLSLLQDRVPAVSMAAVRSTLQGEFGGNDIDALFDRFDPVPVAAASLAQVHRAVTHDGQEVAVKVQYPYVRTVTAHDIKAIKAALALISLRFKSFDMSALIDEFQANVRRELDFVAEAAAGERIAALLAADSAASGGEGWGSGEVYVPGVRWDLVTPRVLTTEFIHGCRVTDLPSLKTAGIATQDVMDTFIGTFAKMIFSFGFVHCDPHPGNVLVRPRPRTMEAGGPGGETYTHIAEVAGTLSALGLGAPAVGGPNTDLNTPSSSPRSAISAWSSHRSGPPVFVSPDALASPSLYSGLSSATPNSWFGGASPPARLRALAAVALSLPRNPPGPEPFEALARAVAASGAAAPAPVLSDAGSARMGPGEGAALMSTASRVYDAQRGSDGWGLGTVASAALWPFATLASATGSLFSYASTGPSKPRRVAHQVVLLDHGLYRELDRPFREGLTNLFQGIYRRDANEVKQGAEKMGAGKYWRVLSLALAQRQPETGASAGMGMTKAEKDEIRNEMKSIDINHVMATVHPDLFFVMKTLNLVRSVNRDLQGTTARRVALLCDAAVSGAAAPLGPRAGERGELWAALPVFAPFAAAAMRKGPKDAAEAETLGFGGNGRPGNKGWGTGLVSDAGYGVSIEGAPEGMVLIDVRIPPQPSTGTRLFVSAQKAVLWAVFGVYEKLFSTEKGRNAILE